MDRPTLEEQLHEYRRRRVHEEFDAWFRRMALRHPQFAETWRWPRGRARVICDLIGMWLVLPIFLVIIDRFTWPEAIAGATAILVALLLCADAVRTWVCGDI